MILRSNRLTPNVSRDARVRAVGTTPFPTCSCLAVVLCSLCTRRGQHAHVIVRPCRFAPHKTRFARLRSILGLQQPRCYDPKKRGPKYVPATLYPIAHSVSFLRQ